MKFLHTADWHLGRTISEYSLLSDQRHRLSQLAECAQQEKVDAIVIAGDLYDRSVPSAQAVSLLDETLYHLTQTLGIPVLAIAGNHDSPQRLAFGSRMFCESGLYICGEASPELYRVTLTDQFGPVDFYLLPYFTCEQLRSWFPQQTIRSCNDAFQVLMQHNLDRIDPRRRNVLVAHGFYRAVGQQAAAQEAIFSESEISIGGSDLIDLKSTDIFDYIALGHLHAPQRAGENARYSGSLLKYSVSEARQQKGFLLVELAEKGCSHSSLLSPAPLRDLRSVKGTLEQLLEANRPASCGSAPSEDYVAVTLTDKGAVLEAMARLRDVFPNILGIRFAVRDEEETASLSQLTRQLLENHQSLSPLELFEDFYQQIRQQPLTPQRRQLVEQIIKKLENDRETAGPKEEDAG